MTGLERTNAGGLTANAVKWIAIAAMLVDHIAWGFVPTDSAAGQAMHVLGRITAPTMCYFLAEGYHYTRSFRRYAARLFVFALIAQIPFALFETGRPFGLFPLNVIYTLFLSLLAIRAWDRIESPALRALAVAGLGLLSVPGDWGIFDLLFALVFWQNRGDFRRQIGAFSVAAAGMVFFATLSEVAGGGELYGQLFQAGVFLSLPLLALYNGRRGGGRYSQWTFYIFYPAHLLVLGLIKLFT